MSDLVSGPDRARSAEARRARHRRALAALSGFDRVGIFVPAIMSVGLVFWVLSEVRELWHSRTEEARTRRGAIAAELIARRTLAIDDVADPPAPERLGLRPRPVYLVMGITLWLGALYVAIGSIANHQRPEGYVASITWLLALALVIAFVAAVFGSVAFAILVTWPTPPPRLWRLLLRSPLVTTPTAPDHLAGRPSWRLSATILATLAVVATLGLVLAQSPHVVAELDRSLADWLGDHRLPDIVGRLHPLGRTETALALALMAGLAALRCRVLASAFGITTLLGLFTGAVLRPLVSHPRPPDGGFAGRLDSFPSGHILLSTILAGLLPLAVAVLFERRWLIRPLRIVFTIGVAAAAADRVARNAHWPTDVAGSILLGLLLVLCTQWLIDTERSHRTCHHCLWSADPHRAPILGAVALRHPTVGLVRAVAHLSASAAAIGLAVLTVTVQVPTNPEGYGISRSIQVPVQLGLALLVSVGALVSWRWEAVGAVLIALAGTGLGIFAAVEYAPPIAVAFTGALLVPSVLLWLSWQHRRRPHEIVALALVTTMLLGSVLVGASSVYDANFGPSHPTSTTPQLAMDRVEWAWAGALRADAVSVTARLGDDRRSARLVLRAVGDEGAGVTRSAVVRADGHRLARLHVKGLSPDTPYRWTIEVDGRPDRTRGIGSLRTPATGAMSFRVAAGSCARTGANGKVYDAIRASAPLLFLASGDFHYGNLESTDPGPFLQAFDTQLNKPAQAALFRSTPLAYVWDDHDYGPNDADARSPGRAAARAAYRRAVPHYEVAPGDAPINQAFTIGRVRFVMTDTRSERTASSMLGAAQKAWLLEELSTAARTHALVVWVNPDPWIGPAEPGNDTWAGYDAERREIARAIADGDIDNLVMVSGDAHMVAIDDGTNSAYAPGAGFAVLHAAALDRPGNVKGGPYSEGAYPGGGQFGLIDVTDDGGDEITVRLSGQRWDGVELVALERTFTVPPGARE